MVKGAAEKSELNRNSTFGRKKKTFMWSDVLTVIYYDGDYFKVVQRFGMLAFLAEMD